MRHVEKAEADVRAKRATSPLAMEWVRSGEAARDDAKMHLDQQFVGWEQAGEGVQEDPLDVIIVGWTWRTAPVIGSLRNFLRPLPHDFAAPSKIFFR